MGSSKDTPTIHQLREPHDWPLWSARLASRLAQKGGTKAIPHFPGDKVKGTNGEITTIKSVAAITATVPADTKTTAYGYLTESIHNDLIPLIDGMRDPGEIVDLLYTHCFGESGTVLDMLTEQFSSMKMGNNESPNMYAARLDLLIKQIEQAGGTTSDTEAASRFRGGLPNTQAWATFTSQCDSYRAINDRSMSYAEIRRAAQLYYPSARKLQSQNAQAFALMPRPYNNKRNHY